MVVCGKEDQTDLINKLKITYFRSTEDADIE